MSNINTVLIDSNRIKRNKDYKKITLAGEGMLHSYGALYRLLMDPKDYNPSLFAITRVNSKPICISSLTVNSPEVKAMLADPWSISSKLISFPNCEIMTYTSAGYRCRGFAKITTRKILEHISPDKNNNIYVYSQTMKHIVESLGYKTINLHEFTK